MDLVKKPKKNDEDLLILKEELREIQFFKNILTSLSELHLNSLIKHSDYEFQPKMSIIFKYDDYGSNFYVIIKGSILVLVPCNNYSIQMPIKPLQEGDSDFLLTNEMKGFLQKNTQGFVPIKEMKSGEAFGELALISNSRRNATIVTSSDTHFLIIGKSHYDQVLSKLFKNRLF